MSDSHGLGRNLVHLLPHLPTPTGLQLPHGAFQVGAAQPLLRGSQVNSRPQTACCKRNSELVKPESVLVQLCTLSVRLEAIKEGQLWFTTAGQQPALWRLARAARATEAGTRSFMSADRRSRCHDQQSCWRERSLPVGSDSWHRSCDAHCNHRRDRQWSSFQEGPRVFRVARNRPGEYTTGGKQKLRGISKRGNSYWRRVFVPGARAVLQSAKQSSGLSAWLAQPTIRLHIPVCRPPNQNGDDESPVLELQFGDKLQKPKKCRALLGT